MRKFINITGKIFNRLTVIKPIGKTKSKDTLWKCLCICGNQTVVRGGNIKNGHVKSCGCLGQETIKQNAIANKERNKTHGLARTPFYYAFYSMKNRCDRKNDRMYKYYGRRGIKCLWKSFENFRDDMYESHQSHVEKFGDKNTTLDRINNNLNYFKENCRWATRKEQANNRRNNHLITFNKDTKTITDWAIKLGIKKETLSSRLRHNWSIEKTLTTHLR